MSMLRQIQEEEHKLEMTPMIDVTFLLLVFFMCTIKFKSLEGKLAAYLPKDVGPRPAAIEPKEDLDVHLDLVAPGQRMLAKDPTRAWTPGSSEGFIVVGQQLAYRFGRETFAATPAGRTELVERLAAQHRADPTRKVVIHPDRVLHGDVVTLLDACLAAGIDAISFEGARP